MRDLPLQFAAFIIALILAVAHLFASRLRFVSCVPRSRWLSFAGGVSVAYVFVHLLPELSQGQQSIERSAAGSLFGFLESHAYLLALLGLSIFYGLEILARESRTAGDKSKEAITTFWVHVSSFAIYNGLIGYLLTHREEQGVAGLILYGSAMGVHFLANDYALNEHHHASYRRVGRWILSGAIMTGWAAGLVVPAGRSTVAMLFAFLSGAVIMNVLKEELPETRESRFWTFAAGVAGFTALMILVDIMAR
jgi:hypothetical protein